ncbi:MAG: DUF3084 domain-containing protein [Oscillatoriales cyanobacterium]|nr:MAG: DUF3084 domain-containing protein [Oscillatoriales cyanobacterium]
MTIGYVLILLATLVLGGAIATMGDRLGTRVGKARLSLFNLRPRQTATLVTIVTGSLISASTLGLLFLAGLFELEEIQTRLGRARRELDQSRIQQEQAKAELSRIDRSLQAAIARQTATQGRLNKAQKRLVQADKQFRLARTQLAQVSKRARQLLSDIKSLQGERLRLQGDLSRLGNENRQLVGDRSRLLGERSALDRQNQTLIVQNRDRTAQIRDREQRLKTIETRLNDANQRFQTAQSELQELEGSVRRLERESQALREGNVALRRGEVLAAATIQIPSPELAQSAINQLLLVGNRTAIERTRPGITPNAQVIGLSRGDVERAIAQVRDGRAYYVQVISSANYLIGEDPPIRVVLEVVPNQVLFSAQEILAVATIDPSALTQDELRDRLELLLGQAQFRAQRAGVAAEGFRVENVPGLIQFVRWLEQQPGPLEVQAVAARDIKTAGPLSLSFVAIRNGQVLYQIEPLPNAPRESQRSRPRENG